LESQQTYDVIRTRKPNENFISHTIADASTCNDSGTEEKCDSDKMQLTDRIDSKNHKCGSLTPLKEGKDKESKSSSKSNQESATNKNSSSLQIDDSWLEELDNKISKSQKKKQKRKAKKKAEQEQMKAEEIEKEIQNSNSKNSIESSTESIVDETPKPKEKENKIENNSQNKQKETNNAKKNNNIEITSQNKKPEQQSEVSVAAAKDESHAKTPTSATISATAETFDDFGFIEVKAKKKTPKELEKDKRSKGRKDGKEGGRRKRKDNEPTPATSTTAAAEKKNPPKESAAKPRSPQNTTETKKSLATEKTSNPNEKTITTTTTITETETHHKPNSTIGIPKVIMATNRSNLKAAAPKPLKKTVSTIAVSSLENPTEPTEPIPALNKAMSQNNATTNSNHNNTHAQENHHHASHSVPSGRKNQNHANHEPHHKSHKPHHPLSLTSPSLDLETIRIAKTKEFAHEFFDKKFESDIYKHVVKLTDEANKMMVYRILAYNRLDYCIKHIFPSNVLSIKNPLISQLEFNIKTKIYGSCATGLALTASDVDISVEGIEAFDRNQLGEYFVKISNSLKGFKWITENKPILTATVPILKLVNRLFIPKI